MLQTNDPSRNVCHYCYLTVINKSHRALNCETLYIREIPGSYLGPEVDCPDSEGFLISFSPGLVSQIVLRTIYYLTIFSLFILSSNAT